MRRLATATLTVALTPVLLALPTVTPPKAQPRPVPPTVSAQPLAGVDHTALDTLRAEGRVAAAAGTGRTAAAATASRTASPKVAVLTSPQATDDFGAVGVSWDAAAGYEHVTVQLRVREDRGWTDWTLLEVGDEGPDLNTAEARRVTRVATDPFLTQGGDGVQVRVDTPTGRPPAGLRLELIDPGTSPADSQLDPALPAASAVAAASKPTIITRAQWGADESLRSGGPGLNSTVRAVILHHTAGSNSYTCDTAARELRSTYAYHTKVRGYSDIGYNFLVDKCGRIYEGRAGSITAAVRGAHAGGFNVDTMGVSAMGNYDVTAPPSVMVEAIARVSAWKLGQYGVDPNASVRLVSQGGGTSKYAAGQAAYVKGFDAHRTVGYTACPGRYLDAKMGTMRSRIDQLGTSGGTPPAPVVVDKPEISRTYSNWAGAKPTVTFGVAQPMLAALEISRCGTVVRRLSRSVSEPSGHEFLWNLKDSNGVFVPPADYQLTLRAGGKVLDTWTYPVKTTRSSPAEVTCPTPPPAPAPAPPAGVAVRVAGQGVDGMSVAIGRAAYPGANRAVVTSALSQRRVDTFAAAALARTVGGPLLQSAPRGVGADVTGELKRRSVRKVFLVGPERFLPAAVVRDLRAAGVRSVVRVTGDHPALLAANVARKVARLGERRVGALVVSAAPDSLAEQMVAANVSARTGRPLLYVWQRGVPKQTTTAFRDLGIRYATVVGDGNRVNMATGRAVARLAKSGFVRISGRTRPELSVRVANAFAPVYARVRPSVLPASDAGLAQAVAAPVLGAPTLLAKSDGLTPAAAEWLERRQRSYDRVHVIATPSALSTTTLAQVNASSR